MSARCAMQEDVIRRNHAIRNALRDHLTHTAEARQRQAEAIAQAVHWVWRKARRALERLTKGTSRVQTVAANGNQTFNTLGRASVADAFGRDLQRLARLVRCSILEPYARRRRRRIAIAELRSLDDHLLADVGLTRGQIERAVHGRLPRRCQTFSRPAGQGVQSGRVQRKLPLAA